MEAKEGKPYGLVLMKKTQSGTAAPSRSVNRSVFDDSDDEAETKVKKTGIGESRVKKQVQKEWEKALEEDPNAFAYDEVYDDMTKKQQEKSEAKKPDKERKPKYIGQLLRTAEKRQHEYEAREERKQQKELEKDAELYGDKEVFVTASYRKKMEELEIYNQEEKRKEQIETLLDVTKQKDLSGFYRHFLNDLEEPNETGPSSQPGEGQGSSVSTKPSRGESTLKEEKSSRRGRTYRKRGGSSSEEESPKKGHSPDHDHRSSSPSDNEFDHSQISRPADTKSKNTLTRDEQRRRRYFTPSPPPTGEGDRYQKHHRHQKPSRRISNERMDQSPAKEMPEEEILENPVIPDEKVPTAQEIIEARMAKLRQLFARRNDESSIDEYKRRYLERKGA